MWRVPPRSLVVDPVSVEPLEEEMARTLGGGRIDGLHAPPPAAPRQ